MGDKENREYYAPSAAAFNYNNVTGGADSASGGSGGSGMECMQLRSPPGPFHYLISEQAKSLVALQELQNEVGALLEFRDLVIETFPNLRSKMAPSTPASGTRREWEPGVRVRRKLAAGATEPARKPLSVQDSGFSTETSCGKDAHSSASASASATRSRPLEDDLWALLDVIQRKGVRLRDEAEAVRCEVEGGAEEVFARALAGERGECACACADVARLRAERDALLMRHAEIDADADAVAAARPATSATPAATPPTALGRLDGTLQSAARARIPAPPSLKFAAILQESNPVELQRQLLTYTVQNQVLVDRLKHGVQQRNALLNKLERAEETNDDLKFRLEEKSAELESARAIVHQLEEKQRGCSEDSLERGRRECSHSSMRELQPLAPVSGTPKRRPSRIPLHRARAPPAPPPPRPPSARSARSAHSGTSARARRSPPAPSAHPAHAAPHDKETEGSLVREYVSRASQLAWRPGATQAASRARTRARPRARTRERPWTRAACARTCRRAALARALAATPHYGLVRGLAHARAVTR